VARSEHDLHGVVAVCRRELLLEDGAQDPADGPPAEDRLPPVVPDPVEDDVAREHAGETNRQREPPSQNHLMGQDPCGDDRQLFRDGGAEACGEKNEEYAGIA
jgi:hypothetical protein